MHFPIQQISLASKYLNTTVFTCHNISWYFLHQSNQRMFENKIFQIMVFSRHIQKNLVIVMKTLSWSEISNT
jgi:hypothetical protein